MHVYAKFQIKCEDENFLKQIIEGFLDRGKCVRLIPSQAVNQEQKKNVEEIFDKVMYRQTSL